MEIKKQISKRQINFGILYSKIVIYLIMNINKHNFYKVLVDLILKLEVEIRTIQVILNCLIN